MPLPVRPSSPARNALLLLGSSHDSVPGTKVSASCLAYSSDPTVSDESRTTLLLGSTTMPPCVHRHQCVQLLASPEAWPKAKPAGVAVPFSFWQSVRKPGRSSGIFSKPAFLIALTR